MRHMAVRAAMGRLVVACCIVLGLTACSDSRPATAGCGTALTGMDVVGQTTTTVGEVREWRVGPGRQRLDAFPEAAASATAYWCWVSDGTRTYTAYGVHGQDKVLLGTEHGLATPPAGAPAIP